jgi:hypothetical protein
MEKRAAQVKGPQWLENRGGALFADDPLRLIVEEQEERDKDSNHLANRFEAFFANFVVANFQSNSVC